MSFTDQKPWIATEKNCKASWSGYPDGKAFRCKLCGYKFKPGDTVRWQYTNDIPDAHGNALVCTKCDRTKEEIVQKIIELNHLIDTLRERCLIPDCSNCEAL